MQGIITTFLLLISLETFFSLQTRASSCILSSDCEAHDYTLRQRAQSDQKLTLTFAVKNKNMDKLYAILDQVSDPKSSEYGKYLSLEQISELTTNQDAKNVVLSHLRKFVEPNQVKMSEFTNFIQVQTNVDTAETMLNGEYHQFYSKNADHEVVRMLEYELPEQVSQVLDWVTPTVDFPYEFSVESVFDQEVKTRSNKKGLVERNKKSDGLLKPDELKSYYNIPTKVVNNENASQLYMSGEGLGSFNPSDIKKFQKKFKLVKHGVDEIVGNNSVESCIANPSFCLRASTQLEWLLALAQNATTTYWAISQSGNALEEYFVAVSEDPSPPLVQAIALVWTEPHQHPTQLERMSEEVAKLGARGVTIIAAVSGIRNCNFIVRAPPNIPYVLSVGATMGPEWGDPERPRQSDYYNYTTTTGGGFSNHFLRPKYQDKVVKKYLSNEKVTSDPRFPSEKNFNASGRAYPDIAIAGSNFFGISNGTEMRTYGMSVSVITAVLTLVNNDRLNAGKPALGFVTPAFYQLYEDEPSIFKDITKGEGLCLYRSAPTVEPACCQKGFLAAEGWDPMTGLGSPDVGKLMQALNKL